MEGSAQQDKQMLSQDPLDTAPRYPYTRSSKDAPEVLPVEYSKDRQQGPILLPGTEDKQVVPNVGEADIQVTPLEHQDLQEPGLQIRIGSEEKEFIADQDCSSGLRVKDGGKSDNTANKRGRSPRCIVAFFIIAVSIIIIVVVPATVLKRPQGTGSPISSPKHTPAITASSTSLPSATSGPHPAVSNSPQARALPGTGMAVLYPKGSSDAAWLVYQDISGGIRRAPYTTSGIWNSSQVLLIEDAFNRSSLTTISHQSPAGGIVTHHLFYIDKFGLLQDMILAESTNTTSSVNSWTPGNLGSYKFKAPLVAGVGMLGVAHNGTYFLESSDAPDFTTAGVLSLLVGGIDGLVHEYKYFAQKNTWTAGFTFPDTNGYSGISADVSRRVMTLWTFNNISGALMGWSPCDVPVGSTCPVSTGETPGRWTQSEGSLITANANSSLSPPVGNFIYYQDPDLSIGYITFAIWSTGNVTGSPRSMNGTSITGGTFSMDVSNPAIWHVFLQSSNGSIMAYGQGLLVQDPPVWVSFGEVPLG